MANHPKSVHSKLGSTAERSKALLDKTRSRMEALLKSKGINMTVDEYIKHIHSNKQ